MRHMAHANYHHTIQSTNILDIVNLYQCCGVRIKSLRLRRWVRWRSTLEHCLYLGTTKHKTVKQGLQYFASYFVGVGSYGIRRGSFSNYRAVKNSVIIVCVSSVCVWGDYPHFYGDSPNLVIYGRNTDGHRYGPTFATDGP